MKHWRFFLILVKEEVLKNMDLSDRLSFSKCSKKCRNLLCRIPNHLESFILPDDNDFSVDDFSILITCRKSNIQKFKVKFETAYGRDQVNQFLLELKKVRHSLKVKKIIVKISSRYSEMYKECIDFCDPSFIESIEIDKLDSQEIYDDISRTPQWKNSREVSLNRRSWERPLRFIIDDFLHFKSIKMRMLELSVDDAWKLVQTFFSNESIGNYIIRSRNPPKVTLIRQKIETELVGEWRNAGDSGARYLVHPKNPNFVLVYTWYSSVFYVRFLTLEEFNRKLDEF